MLELFNAIWTMRGYFVAAILFLIGIKCKSSRIVTFLFLIFFWILIGLNTVSADYDAYKEMYLCCNEPRYAGHEPGYMALCKLFLALGASFETFRAFAGALIVIILICGIKRITTRPNYVLSLMLIFPLVGYVSGLRNSFSNVIFVYSASYLLEGTVNGRRGRNIIFEALLNMGLLAKDKNDERKKIIKYILIILIACLFHYSSIFFLVFLYAKHSKKKTGTLLVMTLCIVVLAVIVSKTGILYSVVSSLTSREKTLNWFSGNESGQMSISVLYILCLGLFGILLYVLYRCRYITEKRERNNILNSSMINGINIQIISRVVVVSLLAFAGAVFRSVVFLRYVLAPIPIAYCVFSESLINYQSDDLIIKKEIFMTRLMMYLFVGFVALFVFGYWIGGSNLSAFVNNLVFQ